MQIVARLTQVRGIGRWTVEMLLMFRLARPDVLPVDDFGVRAGFQAAYGLSSMPHPKALLALRGALAAAPLGGGLVPVARAGPEARGHPARAGRRASGCRALKQAPPGRTRATRRRREERARVTAARREGRQGGKRRAARA